MLDMSKANCLNEKDPDIFFSDENEEYDHKKVAYAKLVCRGCEIKNDCFLLAIEMGNPVGIYGGLTEKERNRKVKSTPRVRRKPTVSISQEANKKKIADTSKKLIPQLEEALILCSTMLQKETITVVQMKIANPEMSLEDIATALSMSRNAVAGRIRRTIDTLKTTKR
jgi:WhiB family redox-sensing transcriptional regulator